MLQELEQLLVPELSQSIFTDIIIINLFGDKYMAGMEL